MIVQIRTSHGTAQLEIFDDGEPSDVPARVRLIPGMVRRDHMSVEEIAMLECLRHALNEPQYREDCEYTPGTVEHLPAYETRPYVPCPGNEMHRWQHARDRAGWLQWLEFHVQQ